MGYVDKNLMPGEQIVYKAKIHWFIFVPGILLFVAGMYFLFGLGKWGVVGPVIGIIAIFLAIFSLLKAFILKVSTELAVTSKRVIAKMGLVSRNTVELNHSKVESFVVDQTILGRIFDFGTLIINGTGGGKTPIPSIDSPLEFRRNAMETIDASQAHQA